MSFTLAYDVTASNFAAAPQGAQLCGYDTGPGVAWTAAMWRAHPGAVHIAQSPDLATDEAHTSDVLDVENGAMAVGSPDIARWAKFAQSSCQSARRPGQRMPALYCSESNVIANVNALIAGGVHSGVGLWIAHWGIGEVAAIARLFAAAGPFPVIGVQFTDAGLFDIDVFSTAWLSAVSGNGWVFGPCRNVKIRSGATTTFGVSGYSPGTPAPLGVGDYEIAVSEGASLGAQVAGYPQYIPKGSTSAFSFTGHGLEKGVTYTAAVRAIATNGGHAGPWVTGAVTPGA